MPVSNGGISPFSQASIILMETSKKLNDLHSTSKKTLKCMQEYVKNSEQSNEDLKECLSITKSSHETLKKSAKMLKKIKHKIEKIPTPKNYSSIIDFFCIIGSITLSLAMLYFSYSFCMLIL